MVITNYISKTQVHSVIPFTQKLFFSFHSMWFSMEFRFLLHFLSVTIFFQNFCSVFINGFEWETEEHFADGIYISLLSRLSVILACSNKWKWLCNIILFVLIDTSKYVVPINWSYSLNSWMIFYLKW